MPSFYVSEEEWKQCSGQNYIDGAVFCSGLIEIAVLKQTNSWNCSRKTIIPPKQILLHL